jgi:hypothetical protein
MLSTCVVEVGGEGLVFVDEVDGRRPAPLRAFEIVWVIGHGSGSTCVCVICGSW